jgi:hypothetical protein
VPRAAANPHPKSTTSLELNDAPAIEVGMVARWKGLEQPRTPVVFATKLEIR